MGMDVIGKKEGSYFRNNVWWWRPLWNYCLKVSPTICGKVENAQSNDGDGLNADDSKALASILKNCIEDGTCEQYKPTTMPGETAYPEKPANPATAPASAPTRSVKTKTWSTKSLT